MMDSQRSPNQAPLPESLRKQLARFQKTLWRTKVTEAIYAALAGLLFSFLIVYFLDRLFPTPAFLRLLILIAGTSLSAFFAPWMVNKWVYKHRREDQLARLISKKFPKLGDRLLGVIELRGQHENAEALSPELRAAAMQHIARQASKRDMDDAMPASRNRKLAIGLLAGVAVTVAALVISPNASVNSLKRWLMPLSKTERYTFTQLDLSAIPSPLPVPYGEPFSIRVPLKKNSDRRPDEARARYGAQDWLSSKLGKDNAYLFEFPPQQAKNILSLQAGDARRSIPVEPLIRPELESLTATITLPDYLRLPPETIDIRHGILSALEGSTYVIKGKASRELRSARLSPRTIPDESPAPPTEFPAENEKKEKPAPPAKASADKPFGLRIAGRRLTSPALPVTENRRELPINWTDIHGLEAESPFQLRLDPTRDQIPTAYTQGAGKEIVLLPEESIDFTALAEDDFGLREIGLSWQGEFTKPTDEKPAKGEMLLAGGSPDSRQLSEKVTFSPKAHDIPPQKLLLTAYTQDYKPGRGRAHSEPITIYILTRDEHAQLLKNRFDRIIGELEDLARREQDNLDQSKRLEQSNDGKKLQQEEARQKLAEQENAEQENADKMGETKEKMQELFKDALRNGEIDKDIMKKMAESLENMKQLAEDDLPEAKQKLQDTQDRKSTAEKTKQDLKDAIKKQKEALEKMKETIKKANEANQNFEASTFINRLKRAASEEDGIANSLGAKLTNPGKNIAPLVGAAVGTSQLDPTLARMLAGLAKQQHRTAGDIRWIQEDLGHFYSRTRKPIHKELMEAMRESQIDTALAALRQRISKNEAFHAVHSSQKWAEKLREWAEKLQGDKDAGGGGGGGGGGANPEDQDFEFMLKVMRMVQEEQDIRARTRSLEQLRRSLDLRKNQPDRP